MIKQIILGPSFKLLLIVLMFTTGRYYKQLLKQCISFPIVERFKWELKCKL